MNYTSNNSSNPNAITNKNNTTTNDDVISDQDFRTANPKELVRNDDTNLDDNTNDTKEVDNNKYFMEIIVSDPQKRRNSYSYGNNDILNNETNNNSTNSNSSSGLYISYQISTKTNNPRYHKENINDRTEDLTNLKDLDKKIIVVHRRYNDLIILYNVLTNEFPMSIIPPIPDKKILEYISGDRFSNSFTQRRCHSIQNFLSRISRHPILKNSNIFEMFLISKDWEIYKKSLGHNTHTNGNGNSNDSNGVSNNPLNNASNSVGSTIAGLHLKEEMISDVIMNAFKSVKHENEEITEIKEKADKLINNLNKINKINDKIIKKNDSIIEDFNKLSNSIENIEEIVNNETLENKLSLNLKEFNKGITNNMYNLRDLNKFIDYEYNIDIKDMEQYVEVVKSMIKIKEQKQIDYEELNEYLNKAINDKNNLISGGNSNSSSNTTSTTSYITNKLEEFAGINVEMNKRDKVEKLNKKIDSLTIELEKSKKIDLIFEKEILKEIKIFEDFKTNELCNTMNNLADQHIEYYEKMLKTWEEIESNLQ